MLATVFALLVAPVVIAQHGGTAGAKDQRLFHLPTIREFAAQLPHVDLGEAHAATGPLYHLLMATVARFVTADRLALQFVSASFSLILLFVLFHAIARRVGGWTALLLVLPLATSNYVVQSAAWMNTDNLALIFVTISLVSALAIVTQSSGYLVAGTSALLAVWVRQVNLWLAGVLIAAGAISTVLPAHRPRRRRGVAVAPRRPLLRAASAALLPVTGALVLFAVWGGVTPVDFRRQAGFSPSAFPFALALVGLFGTPFLMATGESIADTVKPVIDDARVRAAAAFVALAGGVTSISHKTGGGLWRLIEVAPTIGERSLLLGILAGWGALVTLHWARLHVRQRCGREAVLLFVALLGLTAATSVNAVVYQRYFEPPILILLSLSTAIAVSQRREEASARPGDRAVIALGSLTAVQLLGCLAVVFVPTMNAAPLS